jgi:cell division protein FtsB
MATLRQRRDPVRIFMRRLMLAGLFLLVILAGSGVWGIYRKDQESIVLRQEAQSQLASLQSQETSLNASIAELQTERGKEAALRDEYSVGDPGEGVVMIVEPPSAAPVAATSSSFQSWVRTTFSWW